VLLALPDTIASASFLTAAEKRHAESRVGSGGVGITSTSKSDWDKKEALECLIDPKTWFFFAIAFLNQVSQHPVTVKAR
jgi:hypothetical protein